MNLHELWALPLEEQQARRPEDVKRERSTSVEVGHKDGRVVLNLYGTSEVPPSYIAWSPAEAREVAGHLLRCAAAIEGVCEDCRVAVAGLCRAHALRAWEDNYESIRQRVRDAIGP